MTRRIVLTGPEASGKTTLARALARNFRAAWLPEQARLYAEQVKRELTAADAELIAQRTIDAEDAAVAGDPSLLLLDTDLISTVVYVRHYYGPCPAWIESAAREHRADLYLLCAPDLPWNPDGVRDRPAQREEMFAAASRNALEEGIRLRERRHRGHGRRARTCRALRRERAACRCRPPIVQQIPASALTSELSAALLEEAAITVALAVLCLGLWRRTRQPYFGWWALAFSLFLLRITVIAVFIATGARSWLFWHQVITGWTALALLWAAIVFSHAATHGRTATGSSVAFPLLWSYIAVIRLEEVHARGFVPAVVFLLGSHALDRDRAPLRYRRVETRGASTLLGWTFLLWGLHHLDYIAFLRWRARRVESMGVLHRHSLPARGGRRDPVAH